jgi:hypothetical protein
MNAKFRMPKLWGENKFNGTVKELLLTIIGTTISIVLTFGTSAWLENKEQQQARRLLAMTIINDIDQSLTVIRNRLSIEERGYAVTNYLQHNIDRLESIPDDTLFIFFNYITTCHFNTKEEFKKTNENIFNSSQESWRTLNDRKFLDNVMTFYNARNMLEKQSKESIYFQKPVTKEEEYQIFMLNNHFETRETFLLLCRNLLQSNSVSNYVSNSEKRTELYKTILSYADVNEENKFLMNISEEDMERFNNNTYMTVRPVKETQLIGTWESVLTDGQESVIFEFLEDHTFTTRRSHNIKHPFFLGTMVLNITMHGTWSIEGDSLVKKYDTDKIKMELDDKDVTPFSENAELVARMEDDLCGEQGKQNYINQMGLDQRVAQGTNIDKTGTRLKLTEPGHLPNYYIRK